MKLLEIVMGLQTSEATYEAALALGQQLEKVPVKAIDKGGFIVNRLVDPFINEAVFMLEEGVGTAEDIDNGCKFGLNHPMAPAAASVSIILHLWRFVVNIYKAFFVFLKCQTMSLQVLQHESLILLC